MATIVTRTSKGEPLTWAEADANFDNLNTDKLEINPALGTPTSGTLTNCTGLPATGVSGTALVASAIGTTVQAYDADLTTWAGITPGTGVATALALNVGSAGAPVVFNGAGGTPSSLVGTNITGTAAGLTAGGNLALTGGNMSGGVNEGRGSIAMHATTMDLFAVSSPNVLDGTGGAVTITAIANAPQAGARRILYPVASSVITNGATFAVDGSANATAAAGDAWEFEAITTSTYKVHIIKKNGMPVQETRFKVGAFTRDTSTASGTAAVTGVGFTPKALVFAAATTGGIATWGASLGFDNGTSANSIGLEGANTWIANGSKSVDFFDGGGGSCRGAVSSLDSDGFTISWTKGGSPTATLTIYYLAMR